MIIRKLINHSKQTLKKYAEEPTLPSFFIKDFF
jgi:hypothetical protein